VGLLTTSIMEVSATFQNAAFQLIRWADKEVDWYYPGIFF
jgi:hypothetical protein